MLARTMLVLVPVLLASTACTQRVDVKQTFRVIDVHGGWYDAGIVDGANKLVPSVTFRIEKSINESVQPLSVNILFKRIEGQTEDLWDEVFLQSVPFTEGNRTALLTVRPEAGFTGQPPQTRAEMLKNSLFRDVRAVIFAKQSSSNWVELARYDIPRVILTQ
jgi:hypothetical protein